MFLRQNLIIRVPFSRQRILFENPCWGKRLGKWAISYIADVLVDFLFSRREEPRRRVGIPNIRDQNGNPHLTPQKEEYFPSEGRVVGEGRNISFFFFIVSLHLLTLLILRQTKEGILPISATYESLLEKGMKVFRVVNRGVWVRWWGVSECEGGDLDDR